MQIPDDLMETELGMVEVKQIIEIRSVKKAAEAVLNPSDTVVANAKARIAWATQAEQAIRNGQEPPEKPGK